MNRHKYRHLQTASLVKVSSGAIVSLYNGNVGIGTLGSSSKLHIRLDLVGESNCVTAGKSLEYTNLSVLTDNGVVLTEVIRETSFRI